MTSDDEKFLRTAVELGLLTNAQSDLVRKIVTESGGRKEAADAAREQGFVTDAQIGTILSAVYSRVSDDAGAQTIEGEHCTYHPDRLATRSCHRCGAPLCPSCGLPEDGFVFCREECLDEYRAERDAVEEVQAQEARKRKAVSLGIGAAAVAVLLVLGVSGWVALKGYLRKVKGEKLYQQAVSARGMRKVDLVREALKYKPDIKGAKAKIPEGYLEAGKFKEAEEAARDVLAKRPDDTGMKKILARSLLAQGKVDDALALYSEIASAVSQSEARELGLDLAEKFDRLEAAAPWLEAALQGNGQDRKVSYFLGMFHRRKGDLDKAVESLQAASDTRVVSNRDREMRFLKDEGGFADAVFALAETARDKKDAALLKKVFQKAKQALRLGMGDRELLVKILEMLIPLAGEQELRALKSEVDTLSKQGDVKGLVRVRGLLEAELGNMAAAAGLLEKALQSHPDDATARRYLLSFYLDQGLYSRARQHLDVLKAVGAADEEMRLWEARLLNGEGRTEEALRLAEGILAENPDVPKALAISAEAYLSRNDFAKGWKRIEKLCAVKPGSWAYLKAFLSAWRAGAMDAAGVYSTRLASVIASLPRPQAELVNLLVGAFSGETDPTQVTDHYMKPRVTRMGTPPANPVDALRRLFEMASVFSFLSAVYSGMDKNDLAAELNKFNPAGLPTRAEEVFDPKALAPVADRMKEGVERLLKALAPMGGNGDLGLDAIRETLGKDYALARSGTGKLSACAAAVRNAAYVLIYNVYGGKDRAMADEGVRLMSLRHERERSLWKEPDRLVVNMNQAVEAMAFLCSRMPYGFIVSDWLAKLVGENNSRIASAEDAHRQLLWQMYSLARIVSAMKLLKDVALLEGSLGRRVR